MIEHGGSSGIDEALIKCAENVPSDGYVHIIKMLYGSLYTVFVQSYNEDTYRSVFALSYALDEPIYKVKRNGKWIS